ncbi:MAG: tRNA pseudouridine(38-40) synthase TruA [Deltaproteobacteria bacterium]|nr:tRNA pseudouridine(38-40) synthase TruA [Deltaproteobacteria bacterium]
MPNFRFTLEYDGTDFAGWQAQAHGQRTVQDAFEAAIERVTGQRLRVAASGRTDAGVHALGQVVSAQIETQLPPAALQRALNQTLPPDLAVVSAERAADDFHARYSATGKLYCYRVWNAPTRSPLHAARAHWVSRELDLPAMAEAAEAFVGRHDFAALQAAGSEVENTLRTLRRVEIEREPSGELVFWIEGDGFLRHMVRNLVVTLLEVGSGQRSIESMGELLASEDRRRAGPTAPARALTLVRVFY